ncbi:MAG TPA: FtsQ-type POTRA domain-containing protein [Microbacteriaceae bacterium]|nr:FtsQ-type POTRA domain-containing protein [Microbacteriaceae bacterium]
MKRPSGFDRDREEAASAAAAKPAKPAKSAPRASSAVAKPSRAAKPTPRAKPADPVKVAKRRLAAERREAQRELARARAERRRYERQEVKRFTVRQRARRVAWWTTAGVVGAIVVLVLVAVFSPILALRQVVVEGTARVDGAAVTAVLEEQLGTPLALVDTARIDAALTEFPIIESYSTETIPPDTLLVRIVERQPVVTVEAANGQFRHVDAAGVTVEELAERIPGVPLVTESGETLPNPAFNVAVEVLRAMPAEMREQVDRITAITRDHVTLWLVGSTQSVEWGSADDSVRKAEVLAQLQAIYGTTPGVFDVSGSSTGIFRQL